MTLASEGTHGQQQGLNPKHETLAAAFRHLLPEADGRGIVVGIMDTGVDPGAAGLQVTTDGKPKVIDVVDCTGHGDVCTRIIRKAENGAIKSACGKRNLVLHPGWEASNPSGEWRVGQRPLYGLYTEVLRQRVRKDRQRDFDATQREALAKAAAALSAFDVSNKPPLAAEVARCREELKRRVEALKQNKGVSVEGLDQDASQGVDDKEGMGPMVEAVVWHDGHVWRAALDTSQAKGGIPLASAPALASYRLERQFGTFTSVDVCNYVLNVYEDGDILSIVTDSHPHGTHVAGIVAAHFPGAPSDDLDGVAPGAQIVSLKIGDGRLGSLETGLGLYRAMKACLDNKCDMINMSFGEPTSDPNNGRFVKLAEQLVYKHNVLYVASAGNNGPGLSTVGAPGGTSSAIMSIGAWVSPAMAKDAHSLVSPQDCGGRQYTWSSRGPTFDGGIGVDISAPGGAISPVPEWTLNAKQLMNGTSMSSPNACGCMALLASALKQRGWTVTPNRLRRAAENSAQELYDIPFAEQRVTSGRGLFDVSAAWKFLLTNEVNDSVDVGYDVEVNYLGSLVPSMRGIYIRTPKGEMVSTKATVSIKPRFHEDAKNREERVAFEQRVELRVHFGNELARTEAEAWVCVPSTVLLCHSGRQISILIDPSKFPSEANLHFAEIEGTDMDAPERGALFRVPITIVEATATEEAADDYSHLLRFHDIKLSAGMIERRFVWPPKGATWAEVTVRAGDFEAGPRSVWLHCAQVRGGDRYNHLEIRKTISITTLGVSTHVMPIKDSCALEVCISQFWGSAGETPLSEVVVDFHGISAAGFDGGTSSNTALALPPGNGFACIRAVSAFRTEQLKPSATLDRLQTTLRPNKANIAPLPDMSRDALWDGLRAHALNLEYSFSLREAATVRPTMPLLNGRMYDGPLDYQMYQITDKNGKVWALEDVYPKDHKLPKGDFTIRVNLRHDDIAILERLKVLPLALERKLEGDKAISLEMHTRLNGIVEGSSKAKAASLVKGESRQLFIAAPPDTKCPKDVAVGSVLLGKISLGKDSAGGDAPCSVPLCFVIPQRADDLEEKKKEKKKPADEVKAKRSAMEVLSDAARDAQIEVLKKLPIGTQEQRTEYEMAVSTLMKQYSDHLPLLVLVAKKALEIVEATESTDEIPRVMDAAQKAAEAAAAAIDQEKLALALGVRADEEADDEDAAARQTAEEKRDQLVEVLCVKMKVLLKRAVTQPEAAASVYKELAKWTDVAAVKHAELRASMERARGRPAKALQALDEMMKDDPTNVKKDVYSLRVSLLEELGWPHMASIERENAALAFPLSASPF
eukprot:TRINITY_DN18781_c0_g2_i1.p1 TRINITY_DN18781_c0_g2~~TRINITY_DN18781_c0_g2_i1.p1  ORF type:complete len:1319 (+),score=219.18 TRINITY_DN18781_c0_g2_i1:95-4051(+)